MSCIFIEFDDLLTTGSTQKGIGSRLSNTGAGKYIDSLFLDLRNYRDGTTDYQSPYAELNSSRSK
jgi:hypothetical protein